jgi:hypothetical protein
LLVSGIATLAVGQRAAAGGTSFTARLEPLNHVLGSGDVRLRLDGSTATITEHVNGLAASLDGGAYPHLQHIHIAGKAQCPSPSADTSGDGVIDIDEGIRVYGAIGTTLSTSGDTGPEAGHTLARVPVGTSFAYRRTIPLNTPTATSLAQGTAVVVVHGLDPATLPPSAQREESEETTPTTLAVSSPALCGPLRPVTDPAGTVGAALAAAGVIVGALALAGRS